MAERAHPDDPGFQVRKEIVWLKGIIPWIQIRRSPYREEFFWRYRWVCKFCKNRDVLDIPCGMGWGTSLLKGCHKLFGVDINPDAIEEASYRYSRHANFLISDMGNLGFKDRIFDVVVCLEGIEHVSPTIGKNFIAETARILRPNGMFFLSSPHCRIRNHSGNPYHIKEYKPEELNALLEPYFKVINSINHDVDIVTVAYIQGKLR
jgi:2-polyprenyl-3-methyl-5-hydroxy-6-metoxy-1,4-benzoquinol methylase